jgi:hypothetical protein
MFSLAMAFPNRCMAPRMAAPPGDTRSLVGLMELVVIIWFPTVYLLVLRFLTVS